MNTQTIAHALLYFLLAAGGLWHILGVFQTAMRILAGPLIIALTVLLCFEYMRRIGIEARHEQISLEARPTRVPQSLMRFLWWSVGTVIAGFLVELAGVKTGVIFGDYDYGETLLPTITNVPIAIGFAWLGMILSAAALAQRLLPARFASKPHFLALTIAVLMVIFDFFMEPAAMRLGYWDWKEGTVPVQNYLAWFVLGYALAYAGLRLGLFAQKQPAFAMHAYLAQILYFLMANMR